MFIPLSGINCVISNECIIACILIAENRSISVGSEKKGGGAFGGGVLAPLCSIFEME